MNFEKFKEEFDRIIGSMTTQELMKELIKRGAKLQRIYNTPMNDTARELEEIKQLAFDTISDLYFEGKISEEEWDDATDKIEELNTESELAALVRRIENGLT